MFTGLVERRGRLAGRTPRGAGARLSIEAGLGALELGESIAVNGVCLTVDVITTRGFEADASSETLSVTTLGRLPVRADVNLERALPVGGRLGGHIVGGHVDGVGVLVEKLPLGEATKLVFSLPPALARFVAPKGSIAVDGTSLTVNHVAGDRFDVVVIPHTRGVTTLDTLDVGAHVNLEADVLARYLARLLEVPAPAVSGSHTAPAASDSALLASLGRAGYL